MFTTTSIFTLVFVVEFVVLIRTITTTWIFSVWTNQIFCFQKASRTVNELSFLGHILRTIWKWTSVRCDLNSGHWLGSRKSIPLDHECHELVLQNFRMVIEFARNNTTSSYYYLDSVCIAIKWLILFEFVGICWSLLEFVVL